MGRLRGWIRRLEREYAGDVVRIPQLDGTVAKFKFEDIEEAFLTTCARLGAGGDAPPIHPLSRAAANSGDERWRNSLVAEREDDGVTNPVPDLSE
jgi:hypothetical protein